MSTARWPHWTSRGASPQRVGAVAFDGPGPGAYSVVEAQAAREPTEERPQVPNIGLPELVIVLVIALVVFGPKRLPEMGQAARPGSARVQGRRPSEIRSQVGVDDIADSVKDIKSSLSLTSDSPRSDGRDRRRRGGRRSSRRRGDARERLDRYGRRRGCRHDRRPSRPQTPRPRPDDAGDRRHGRRRRAGRGVARRRTTPRPTSPQPTRRRRPSRPALPTPRRRRRRWRRRGVRQPQTQRAPVSRRRRGRRRGVRQPQAQLRVRAGPRDRRLKAGMVEFDERVTLVEHLDELRRRIVYAAIALAVGVIVAAVFNRFVFAAAAPPAQDLPQTRPTRSSPSARPSPSW